MVEIKHNHAGWEAKRYSSLRGKCRYSKGRWQDGELKWIKENTWASEKEMVMKTDGKPSSSRITPLVGPQQEAPLRHEEAGRTRWMPRLPDMRKEDSRERQTVGEKDKGSHFSWHWIFFQMSYFSKVSKEDPLPVCSLHLGFETYRKQSCFPWPLCSSLN